MQLMNLIWHEKEREGGLFALRLRGGSASGGGLGLSRMRATGPAVAGADRYLD